MQPYKLIRYAAITLILFYFSTTHGFLDTCPKKNSPIEKCYQRDSKHRDFQRSERRVTDVPLRREENRRTNLVRDERRTDTEDRRVLDRNNNRLMSEREHTSTARRDTVRERRTEITRNNGQTTRFRSFNTISMRSDRMASERRNAGNSIQKPVFDNDRRNVDENVGKTIRRRFSKTHESEDRRSMQSNSNEFRQRESTERRNSADVLRKQFRIREAEVRIRNLERTNNGQDKNIMRNERDRQRQTDRVLTDRRSNEDVNDSQRSFDNRKRTFVRSTEDNSRYRREEQISSDRRSFTNRESVFSGARRDAAPSVFRREERTPFARDGRQSSMRREFALSDARRNSVSFRFSRQDHDGFRRELIPYQDTSSYRFRQEQQRERRSSIRRLVPSDVRRDASGSEREERLSFARDDRQSAVRRDHAVYRFPTMSNSPRDAEFSRFRQEERRETFVHDNRRQTLTRRLSPEDARPDTTFTRESARDGRQSSIHRDLTLSNTRSDAEFSKLRREGPSRTSDEARRFSSFDVRRNVVSSRTLSTRDSRQSSIQRDLISTDTRQDAETSRFRSEERLSRTRDETRRLSLSDVRRDAVSSTIRRDVPREDRQSSIRELTLSNSRRDTEFSRFTREERLSRTRDETRRLSSSDVRRDAVFSTIRRDVPRDGRQSSIRREITSSNTRENEFEQRQTRRLAPTDIHRVAITNTFRREIVRDSQQASAHREFALSNTRRDAVPFGFRQQEGLSRISVHRKRAAIDDRRQSSTVFPTSRNRLAARDLNDQRRTSTSRRSTIQRELNQDQDRIRRSRYTPTSRTEEQHLNIRRSLEANGRRRIDHRQSPSHLKLESNERRHTILPSRSDVNSRRLLDKELYSRATSFSERAKSQANFFGNKDVQLMGNNTQGWSILAKTLLIALTLFQILAKTYPKKIGFQNLLHHSLGSAKQKVQ